MSPIEFFLFVASLIILSPFIFIILILIIGLLSSIIWLVIAFVSDFFDIWF